MLFWNTQGNGDAKKTNHFLTMERDVWIRNIAWISENQIALGFNNGWIEIFQMNDIKGVTTTWQINKRFQHGVVSAGNEGKEDSLRDTFSDDFQLLFDKGLDEWLPME